MSGKGTKNKKPSGAKSSVTVKKPEPDPKKDIRKLQSELKEAKESKEALAMELKQCRFDLVTLQKNFNYEEVRKTLPSMQDNDGLQADQCARLTSEIARLQGELNASGKKNGNEIELNVKIKTADTTLEIVQKEPRKENQRNKGELTQTKKGVTDLKSKYEKMEQLYQDEKAEKSEEERELTRKKTELTNLKSKFENMEQRYQDENAENERTERELNDKIQILGTSLEDKQKELEEEKKKGKELQEQISNLQTGSEGKKELKDETVNLKTRELTESKKDFSDLKSEFEKMKQRYQDEKAEKEWTEKELNDKIQSLGTSLEHKLKELEEEKKKNIEEFTETKKDFSDLKSELEKMKQRYQDEKSEKERTERELNDKIKSLGTSREDMQIELKEEKKRNMELKEQLSNMETGTGREKELKDETENLKMRLSELAGAQLMTNNPNIADLSDNNRPTKLAEKYSELYDNEWTNAYELYENNGLPEVKIIQTLHGILVDSFKFCFEVSKEQTKQLKLALTTVSRGKKGDPISDDAIIPTKLRQLRELKKAFAPDMIEGVFQSYKREKKPKNIDKTPVKDYTYKCITLSWYMSVQDPPVVIDTENHTGNFDSNIFRTYTKTGALIDYVVWPPLYLHEGGSMLYKGVAQGK